MTLSTDHSTVFARWRQCARPSNTWFPGSMRVGVRENVCNNSKNVKSHVFLKSEKNVKKTLKNVGLPPTYSFTGRSVTQFSTFRSLLTALGLLFTARCYACAVYAFVVCPSVCPSQVGVLLKRLSHIQHHMIAQCHGRVQTCRPVGACVACLVVSVGGVCGRCWS